MPLLYKLIARTAVWGGIAIELYLILLPAETEAVPALWIGVYIYTRPAGGNDASKVVVMNHTSFDPTLQLCA